MTAASPWQQHVQRWSNCTRCHLQHCRTKVILGKGVLPAYILFLGEAPAESEDALGFPFAGPAGFLLDDIIKVAVPEGTRMAFTNCISCIPRDEDWQKVGKPGAEELQRCLPRLKEFVSMCRPKLVVLVGKEAAKWVNLQRAHLSLGNVKMVEIIHPAAILRNTNEAFKPLEVKRCIINIMTALEGL